MTNSFEKGFEKTAFIGNLASRLGRSGINWVMKGAKNVGSKGTKTLGSSLGTAAGLGFGAMEAQNVFRKTQKAMKPHVGNMKNQNFYSVNR